MEIFFSFPFLPFLLLSLPWVNFYGMIKWSFFLVMIIFFFSGMFLLSFISLEKDISFLFFSILFSLFFIFGKRKFFFTFLRVRCFINVSKNFPSFFVEKEESGQRRDWNSFRYFNPASNITRLSVLQEFQLLRLKLSGSFKHSEFQPLLRRYRFEELRRKFWLGYIYPKLSQGATKFALRMMECNRSRDSIMRLSWCHTRRILIRILNNP